MISRTIIALAVALLTLLVFGLGIAIISFLQTSRVVGLILLGIAVFGLVWLYDWYTDHPSEKK